MPVSYEVNGIDVSRWQKVIEWDIALSQGILFAIIKATEGYRIIDSQLERNMRETALLHIPRGIYHYFKPDQDWKRQARHFGSIALDYMPELELVMDLEKDGGLTRNELNNVTSSFVDNVQDITDRPVMIYTSPGFFNGAMPLTSWAWRHPLWVAHWTKGYRPTTPTEWSKHNRSFLYWQWSSRNGLGPTYGVGTKNIDLNRFNGSIEQFMKRYSLESLPIEPNGDDEVFKRAPKYEVLTRALHVRMGPGTKYPIVRDLVHGDIIEVTGCYGPKEAWVQIGEDQWAASAYNGAQFMRKVN